MSQNSHINGRTTLLKAQVPSKYRRPTHRFTAALNNKRRPIEAFSTGVNRHGTGTPYRRAIGTPLLVTCAGSP
jgi:hypothetical protein